MLLDQNRRDMEVDLGNEQSVSIMPVPINNSEVLPLEEPTIANDLVVTLKSVKINGDTKGEDSDKVDSSDCDTLVIDEKPSVNRKRKLLPFELQSGFKGFKRLKTDGGEFEPPTNPYFNESLFELSGLHHNEKPSENTITYTEGSPENAPAAAAPSVNCKKGNAKKKKLGSPKLREYAQYLGLQPTVQFKCSRCAQSGFPSLTAVNEHHNQCTAQGPIVPPMSTTSCTAPSTNFRVTRKVFLCSACGTYYENWNLFLHMREVHKRFICLYCLGMFSQPEKLTLHLVSKHNCVPNRLESEEDFFQIYKEPCFLMCCECETVFGESDNFFNHQCSGKVYRNINENKSKVTNNTTKPSQKINNKNLKSGKNKGSFVEHVTGDTQAVCNENDTVSEMKTPPTEDNVENTTQTQPDDTSLQASETYLSQSENQVGDLREFENQDDLKTNLEAVETDSENMDNERVSNETQLEVTKPNETILNITEPEAKESVTEDEIEDESNKSTESKSRSPSPFESPAFEETSLPLNYEERLEDIDEFLKSNELEQQEETRKVPKVTLKLPKLIQPYIENGDSDDSEKLTMEVDSMDCEHHSDNEFQNSVEDEKEEQPAVPEFPIAGPEIPIIELGLEQPLDKFDVKILLQKCLKETVATCTYCNHARRIAVNGKQLGLHAIAEHRFAAVVNSITAEELIPESFVMRIKEGFPELETSFFSIESNTNDEGVTFSHVFECFQCRYATTVHKELYLHNRKMHAKTILLCIMCKSNFYSYSELICHLCPGVYVGMELNNDISFRCCMCITDDLPSAFRLMVHLRKRHHACDVCLELCNNQSKLSNHVWKHKLHHLCYRCGIAYRNKPDITKHLFWKHGTESVLCKKCLQKKWPHVYHFCIPPSTFTCEECNLMFSKAVSLKVHKRLHNDSRPHTCTFENCCEKFISKKLLLKHEFKHREPPEEEKVVESLGEIVESKDPSSIIDPLEKAEEIDVEIEKEEVKPKPIVDVYDLPELNLSESDSSDSETEEKSKIEPAPSNEENIDGIVEIHQDSLIKLEEPVEVKLDSKPLESLESSVPVLHNIWDDFKNYQASKTKTDTGLEMEAESQPVQSTSALEQFEEHVGQEAVLEIINKDHDYCISNRDSITETKPNPVERTQSMDHDYCFSNNQSQPTQEQEQPIIDVKPKSPVAPEKKETKPNATSDSSDDSDSSSCECNSNCSCSSTSGSSSSSSDSSDSDSSSSEGRRKQQARREKRRRVKLQKGENKTAQTTQAVAPIEAIPPPPQTEQQIEESDLYTTESETDEDFYDQQPQKLANKLLAEKRKLLLAGLGPMVNGSVLESSRPSTPSLPETEAVKPKKKSKNKKKKKKNKKNKSSSDRRNIPSSSYQYQYQPSGVSPLTLSFPKLSPNTTPIPPSVATPHSISNSMTYSMEEHGFDSSVDNMNSNDSSLRASKRRRIPNRFYGYSSEEDHDRYQPPVLKWRKADLPSPVRQSGSPLTVPPITLKNIPAFVPEEPILPRSISIPNDTPGTPFQRVPPTILARPSEPDSGTETNDSSSEEEPAPPPPHQPPHFLNKPPNQPTLYCYCRCPYDEVSEMIGCDSDDCMIEWFHFECVGIMVPPKGQWYCPDCRKKKQAEKERLALGQV